MPVEMVQFLLKLLLKQNSCGAPRFPLIAMLLQNCWQPNFIHVMIRSRCQKFWKGWSQTFYLRLHNPGCPSSRRISTLLDCYSTRH